MVMLDGIGKDIGLAFAVFLSVLLRSQDDGLSAVEPVNPVNHFIEPLHLLELFSVDVEEVLLDGTVSTDAHDDDTRFLILIARPIYPFQSIDGSLCNGNGRAAGCNQSLLLKVPVLCKILPESIGVEENAHGRCNRTLHP